MKEDLYAVVSEDLRYPLSTVQASLNLLLAGSAGNISDKVNKTLRLVSSNVQRAFFLIDDFLDLRSLDNNEFRFELEEVQASTVVSHAV